MKEKVGKFEDRCAMIQQMIREWKIKKGTELNIDATVPGDITADLFRANVIEDPLWGMNHKALHWIIESDFTYTAKFDVSEDVWEQEQLLLTFDGIDTFADIYFNGQFLGSTDNMFLQYEYDVKNIAKEKDNLLEVKMLSTKKRMDAIDTEDYFGIFHVPRLFVRKAQCHFGWDWAPNMPGYGIYKPVRLCGVSRERIKDVSYKAYNDGSISLFTEVNYDVIPMRDYFGKVIEEIPERFADDKLIYRVAKVPNEKLTANNTEAYEQKVSGRKSFVNFRIPEPKLWWPSGYGEQPLYEYSVELIRDGKVLDVKSGRFVFREVRLEQRPIGRERLECKFVINGTSIFAKGSNWVPAECFVGEMKKEKYYRLLQLAKEGNINMLRVWGGGVYEDDVFYELCDELGIMVWQDMMFACADIPEECPEFIENVRKEIDYQIRRLRSHPSIVVWSGANEKVGTLCKQRSHGDYFLEVILRGMVQNLDDTRPMIKQSPHGMGELENDMNSGDTHASSYESALHGGIEKYRDFVSDNIASFKSECAVMGPGTADSYKKIFPSDKLWPMNEYWEDRLMGNPYAEVVMCFAERQRRYADALYGESGSLEEFICKGMTTHAEVLRAEVEHARAHKGTTWGIMNWMYSDSWPSGNWSVVGYDCEPKQAFYQMKKSYAPVLLTFVQVQGRKTYLVVVNDEQEVLKGVADYGQRQRDGTDCWREQLEIEVPAGGVFQLEVKRDFRQEDTYLFASAVLNGQPYRTVYSYDMWKSCAFESDYAYKTEMHQNSITVTIKANQFAKGVTLRLPDNEKYLYSDNYFDMEAGEEKSIFIFGTGGMTAEALVVTDFAKEKDSNKKI